MTAALPENPAQHSYLLEGTLLEACDCNVLCPCWVGEDPDNGTCDSIVAHHVDRGLIRGVDVSGLTWLAVAHIPGNILRGNIRSVSFVDEAATSEQFQALTDAFTGRLGGPLEDSALLIGEHLGVFRAPISYCLSHGEGTLTVGGRVRASMTPYRSGDGTPTTLRDSLFSTIPGSPAWIAKTHELAVDLPEHGFTWRVTGRNAIQGQFRLKA